MTLTSPLPIKPAPAREPELVSKVCKGCGRYLPLTEYYRANRHNDRLFGKCKECHCAQTRAYRAANDAVRERDRNRRRKSPERSAAQAALVRQQRLEHPERSRAYNAVRYALQTGKLVRQPCEVCGTKAQAHHDDYSKPLEVRWLCARHHAQHHAEQQLSKWVMVNDEWVEAQFLLARSASGLSDRPAARSARNGS